MDMAERRIIGLDLGIASEHTHTPSGCSPETGGYPRRSPTTCARSGSRHAKSNSIDAEALARLAIVTRESCDPSSCVTPMQPLSTASCCP
jgi:hypothetical protein